MKNNSMRIGNHMVQHGNVMNSIAPLMADGNAEIFYSDPPWGSGNLKYWQTINSRMTGAEKIDIEFNAFLERIFTLAYKYSNNLVFIEYGTKWNAEIQFMGEAHGLFHLGIASPYIS